MARGKNIQLYLMDGDVNGRIKCTLANWTGLAFKIPRTSLDVCKDRPELKQTGVYFLFGKDENDRNVVYIGQAGVRKNGEGILNRLFEHNRKWKSHVGTPDHCAAPRSRIKVIADNIFRDAVTAETVRVVALHPVGEADAFEGSVEGPFDYVIADNSIQNLIRKNIATG